MPEAIPDKGLYEVTQFLFDQVRNRLPERLHNLPVEVSLEGYLGAYLLTRALQWGSKKVVDRIVPGFDQRLPVLEKICEIGFPAAFLLYSLIDQDGARDLIYSKPMDNLGIVMAYLGGVTAVEQDLHRRSEGI